MASGRFRPTIDTVCICACAFVHVAVLMCGCTRVHSYACVCVRVCVYESVHCFLPWLPPLERSSSQEDRCEELEHVQMRGDRTQGDTPA